MCPTVTSGRGSGSGKVFSAMATPGQGPPSCKVNIRYTDPKLIGNGSFGVVYQAQLLETQELVAIKKVHQNKKFKNRELEITQKLNHCNIVKLKYFFYSREQKEALYLNLVMEFLPATVYKVACHYNKLRRKIPMLYVKLYAYQLFRSLAYLHSLGICHRDIKPQNLLVDMESGVLKLCDFGSAKCLVKGEKNVAYICSRYYRAPEILFSAEDYTTTIDVWSAGCVLAELMLGKPLFVAECGLDQIVEIIKVLGVPTKEQLMEMNKDYAGFSFPAVPPCPWQEVFTACTSPEAIDLVSCLLQFSPSSRLTPLQACAHKCFDELREPGKRLSNNRDLPPLFNFTEYELKIQPNLNSILIPAHLRSNPCSVAERSEDCSTNDMTAGASSSFPIAGAAAASDPQPCTSADA